MGIIKEILITVLSSSIVSGIFIFFLKNYIVKGLGLEFDKKKNKLDLKTKNAEKLDGILIDDQIAIYPQLIYLCSRICNIMEEGIKKKFAYEWDPSFRSLCATLTESLYKHRYFLPPDIYSSFHKIKRMVQDNVLIIDIFTREENVFDKNKYSEQLNKLIENTSLSKKELNEVHLRIYQENKEIIKFK